MYISKKVLFTSAALLLVLAFIGIKNHREQEKNGLIADVSVYQNVNTDKVWVSIDLYRARRFSNGVSPEELIAGHNSIWIKDPNSLAYTSFGDLEYPGFNGDYYTMEPTKNPGLTREIKYVKDREVSFLIRNVRFNYWKK